jgi:hypothetical protein
MKISIDKRTVLLIIFALGCLAIGISILVNGWFTTWTTLQVPPPLSPPFFDMRTVQGSLLSDKLGFDPQVKNPGDLTGRTLDYPKIWVWIAKLFQLDNETNLILFVCVYILAYIVCCLLLLRDSPSLYLLLAIFSGTSLLAVERGNNELLVFALLFAGICLSQRYFRGFTILLATVLKLFPALLVVILAKKPKILFVVGLILAGYFMLIFGELRILLAGNTALNDPNAIAASYGFNTNTHNIQQLFTGQSAATYAVIKYLFILVSLVLIAFISRSKYLNLTGSSEYKTDLLIAGGIIFSGTYLITSNWDYRLIFLFFCIPYILSIQNGFVRHSMLIGILLASNVDIVLLNSDLLWRVVPFAIDLCTLSKYYLFLTVTACLVRELKNYFSVISLSVSKSYATSLLNGPP